MTKDQFEALAEKIIEKIRARPKHRFDPVKLAKGYKVTREDIISGLGLLQQWGYKFKADQNGFFSFLSAPDKLLAREIAHRLKTKIIGCKIHSWQSVQSTNTLAGQLAAIGAPEGTVVVAEQQTRGRGRFGRTWHSPAGLSVYCSIILRPKIPPTLAPGISLITAVAVADTIASYGDIDVKIKWPNDILISGKKTAGILTELSAEIGRTNFVIVGVGININHKISDFPEPLRKSATAVRIGLKREIRRVDFLKNFMAKFEKEYLGFKKRGLAASRKRILKYSSLINSSITLKIGRKTLSGNVLDIDGSGRLVVETAEGIRQFSAGEVTMHESGS
ncbi:MAG: biotin--[acetyl-CoA-carboxylase] ligase [candidate division Zixibacteria bacterium HGW-Zixibacteria-1]|nr:MAG: biotin--[acetyl-CoA-carboxylase] ligase [candidate division Zixibacteria bacterium HGW-Zixibacteria-1]